MREQNPTPTPEACFINPGSWLKSAMLTPKCAIEDFGAHTNYTELALREMGFQEVFPHTGSATEINVPGAQHPVFPLVTGTFGMVDFLHSV